MAACCETGSRPTTRTAPSSGLSSPHSRRIVVVLPAPSGPIRPNISPRLTGVRRLPHGRGRAEPFRDAIERERGVHGYFLKRISASTGMPCLSTPLRLSTETFTRKTSFDRSSAVCTLRGVNSALGEMKVTVPAMPAPPASVKSVACLPEGDARNERLVHVDVGPGTRRGRRRRRWACAARAVRPGRRVSGSPGRRPAPERWRPSCAFSSVAICASTPASRARAPSISSLAGAGLEPDNGFRRGPHPLLPGLARGPSPRPCASPRRRAASATPELAAMSVSNRTRSRSADASSWRGAGQVGLGRGALGLGLADVLGRAPASRRRNCASAPCRSAAARRRASAMSAVSSWAIRSPGFTRSPSATASSRSRPPDLRRDLDLGGFDVARDADAVGRGLLAASGRHAGRQRERGEGGG